jgi:UDP-3-O-[3-hydroxymyristoyl] glucosamine N-acyltransferase
MVNSDENPDSFLKNKYGEFVVIKSGTKIGFDVVIYPHCFIESNVVIGNGVIIESGVIFSKNVTVGDDVHIGSNPEK